MIDKKHVEVTELQENLADEQQKLQRAEQERDDIKKELDLLKQQLATSAISINNTPSNASMIDNIGKCIF